MVCGFVRNVQTVNVRKEENRIKLNFIYNKDLYLIMKDHHGYFFKKEKAWIFPLHKFEEIKRDLESKNYKVVVKTENEQTTLDAFSDPDVLSQYGICKKCGQGGFIDRNGLCTHCK